MSTISHAGEIRPLSTGKTIFDYADELAVEVPTSCGRTGRCHECVVEVTQGMAALTAKSEAEAFLRDDFRLACQAVVARDDLDVAFAPLRRRPRILTLGTDMNPVELDPMVTVRGDDVLYDGAVIDRFRGHVCGLAIDLGTTTVVIDLIDLLTGRHIQTTGFENPQRFAGSDVIQRIVYDGGPFTGMLQQSIIAAINRELRVLSRRLGIPRRAIYEIAIAGNSTMRDIFFGLDVQSIGQRPYKSMVEHEMLDGKRDHTALLGDAWQLGLRVNRQARVYGLPLIASHVGADAAAALLAVGMESQAGEPVMLVDMGTNTEVVIRGNGRMFAASCPAGPAFEGGLVKYGMPASDGAIETLRLGDATIGDLAYRTIGDAPPEGLCGSGLIDLLAELRRHDVMTAKGVFVADRKQFQITLVPDRGITFSKEDASNLGQAKAASYCGQQILLRTAGLAPDDISTLYLAGGFANYVDVENAIAIGLLAPIAPDRIVKVGNAAIRGTRAVLLSRRKRRLLENLVRDITHVELETTADFFEIFVDGCQFKPMPTAGDDRSGNSRRRSAQ